MGHRLIRRHINIIINGMRIRRDAERFDFMTTPFQFFDQGDNIALSVQDCTTLFESFIVRG